MTLRNAVKQKFVWGICVITILVTITFYLRPLVFGPSKTQIAEALGESADRIEVLKRFQPVSGDHLRNKNIAKEVTLYPIRVKTKDQAYEGQKADTGWSDEQLRSHNFQPFDTDDVYLYEDDFGRWKVKLAPGGFGN
jgi:hypothetical protein